MDKKTLITIILAAILALVSAFVLLKRNNTEVTKPAQIPIETKVEKDFVSEEKTTLEEDIQKDTLEQTSEKASSVIKLFDKKQIQTNSTQNLVEEVIEQPIFDNIVVQEGSVIKEVEEDYGIKKDGDIIEVTREFRLKTPVKYTFKGFGFLDSVTTK